MLLLATSHFEMEALNKAIRPL